MVLGLVIFSWDRKLGPVIDMKYPLDFHVSNDLINKIYITFTYSDDIQREELVETSITDFSILSYCDKSKISKEGYEIVSIILEEKDKLNIHKIRSNLTNFSREIFQIEKEKRKSYFNKNLEIFFKKAATRKILLLGRAGTGKTSIKKIIFEGVDPKELLLKPLEPTRGINPNVYTWLDIRLGIFDSSGQELNYLLDHEEENDFLIAFENTDIIAYIIDYNSWNLKNKEIEKEIQKIMQIIKLRDLQTELVLFVHKIDLIEKQNNDTTIKNLKNLFHEKFNLETYFTSIHPEWIYRLYDAFYNILSNSSQETMNLRLILEDQINGVPKTMVFFTNLQDSIIVQSMSNDFNTNIINHSHKLIAELNQNFEEMSRDGKIDHLILSSAENFNIILNNLNMVKFGLKYMIVISESLTTNKLILLVGQIRLKLKDYYYLDKKVA